LYCCTEYTCTPGILRSICTLCTEYTCIPSILRSICTVVLNAPALQVYWEVFVLCVLIITVFHYIEKYLYCVYWLYLYSRYIEKYLYSVHWIYLYFRCMDKYLNCVYWIFLYLGILRSICTVYWKYLYSRYIKKYLYCVLKIPVFQVHWEVFVLCWRARTTLPTWGQSNHQIQSRSPLKVQ